MEIDFFVPGVPAPGGSKKAFVNKRTGRAQIVDDCTRNKPWREAVAWAAREAYQGPLMLGPLALTVEFVMPRPKGHYKTCQGQPTGEVKLSAPRRPTTKPDATKLLRALEDALTGVLWHDDAQIVEQWVFKLYVGCGTPRTERPGARVRVAQYEPPPGFADGPPA